MGNDSRCPICHSSHANFQSESIQRKSVDCAVCGKFHISTMMEHVLTGVSETDRLIASAYLRERELKHLPPIIILAGNPEDKPQGTYDLTPVAWDSILREGLPARISERLDRTLCNLSRMVAAGKWIPYLGKANWVLAYAEDENSWRYIVDQLKDDKYVEEMFSTQTPDKPLDVLRLTPKGWNRVAEIERGTAALQYRQAFVAMWFDDSMGQAWNSGFKPGVEEGTGIKAARVDLKEHNDKICDVIIAEIRKSSFLIADFTGNRGGVYFEAGFAKGLGIPVIFSCQKGKWEKKLHFDTRQYNHIIWETPEDLKNKLQNRIRATIQMENQSAKQVNYD